MILKIMLKSSIRCGGDDCKNEAHLEAICLKPTQQCRAKLKLQQSATQLKAYSTREVFGSTLGINLTQFLWV